MRRTIFGVIALGAIALSGAVHAQGFTPQQLDKMSQDKLNSGAYRNLGGKPAPQSSIPKDVLHQPAGMWVCMGTGDYQPVLSDPAANAPQIGLAYGRVAAGSAEGAFTRVLVREGKVGYVATASIKPYENKFNPRASCSIGGLRPDGSLVFALQ
jgi:hypothetical protein